MSKCLPISSKSDNFIVANPKRVELLGNSAFITFQYMNKHQLPTIAAPGLFSNRRLWLLNKQVLLFSPHTSANSA